MADLCRANRPVVMNAVTAPQPGADLAQGFKQTPKKKRPVRGDNRTGRAIWALGVDGRSRLI
jgi:hypothetical protein